MENFPLPCLIIGGYQVYVLNHLHGKRLIERRLFFQPLQVHFPCVFSGISAFVYFLDPVKSCDKLLRFIIVVSVRYISFYHKGCRT